MSPGRTFTAALAVAITAVGLSGCGAAATVDAAAKPKAAPLDSYDCARLGVEAAKISKGENVELLKVRAPKIVKDSRKTYKKPTGSKSVVLLTCKGTGVWSDGDEKTMVMLSLKMDADGSLFAYYQPL